MTTTERWSGKYEVKKLKEFTRDAFETAQKHIHTLIESQIQEAIKEQTATHKARFLFSLQKSMQSLAGYATLDYDHAKDIERFSKSVHTYATVSSFMRPLNWALVAPAGEGKNHFIDCISQQLAADVTAVPFNMASMRNSDDLESVLDAARNVTVDGKIPLVFFDEFDNDPKNIGLLLPLLWDGQIVLGSRRLKLGRAVIVISGSDEQIMQHMTQACDMRAEHIPMEHDLRKLPDLISRVNGGILKIPALKDVEPMDRRIDKVCIAAALLRRKFEKDRLMSVPASLFNFVYETTFRYGARSIEHLIGVLQRVAIKGGCDPVENGVLRIAELEAILTNIVAHPDEGLENHFIHPNKAQGIKENWDKAKKYDHIVPIWCKVFDDFKTPSLWAPHAIGAYSYQLERELAGEVTRGQPVDVTSYAGIEPLHITQLWLDEDNGEWDHGNKDLRHVFFNLSTLRQLMQEVVSRTDRSPKDVGRDMGASFGRDFVRFLKEIGEAEPDMKRLLGHWIKFDVSGGWGMWEYSPESNEQAGEVRVRNSFFAAMARLEATQGECLYCPILEGYIEGVVKELAHVAREGRNCSANVEKVSCDISKQLTDPKTSLCVFKYTINDLTPRGADESTSGKTPK